ncbi:MAG: hypothetical protein HY719_04730 [Planctomycetes bacterium]|nr:hypothetical protein [Planctomycetota bacterium]
MRSFWSAIRDVGVFGALFALALALALAAPATARGEDAPAQPKEGPKPVPPAGDPEGEWSQNVRAQVDRLGSREKAARDGAQAWLIEQGAPATAEGQPRERCAVVVRELHRAPAADFDAWLRREAIVRAIRGDEFEPERRGERADDLLATLARERLVEWTGAIEELEREQEPLSPAAAGMAAAMVTYREECLAGIRQGYAGRGPIFRQNVTLLLGNVDDPRAAAMVRGALADDDPLVRAVATFSVAQQAGFFDEAGAVAELARLSAMRGDTTPGVRWCAVRASRWFSRVGRALVPALIAWLGDGERVVRHAAADLLEQITAQPIRFNPAQTLQRRAEQIAAWERWWNGVKDRPDVEAILRPLARPDPNAYRDSRRFWDRRRRR